MFGRLVPRRQTALSTFGSSRQVNERWIKDGIVNDADPLPWLRGIQRSGYELIIIGYSVDACRVCIEAWAAGFRPVLIIMEDHLEDNEEEVRAAMKQMVSMCSNSGVFRHGPVLLYSDKDKCTVQLDDEGRVTEVLVVVSEGKHSMAEAFQLFRWPAIVIDPINIKDEVHEVLESEPSDTEPEAEAEGFVAEASSAAERCACGALFQEDAVFCHRCGERRPEASADEASLRSNWGAKQQEGAPSQPTAAKPKKGGKLVPALKPEKKEAGHGFWNARSKAGKNQVLAKSVKGPVTPRSAAKADGAAEESEESGLEVGEEAVAESELASGVEERSQSRQSSPREADDGRLTQRSATSWASSQEADGRLTQRSAQSQAEQETDGRLTQRSAASTQSQKAEQEADGRLTQRSVASTQSQNGAEQEADGRLTQRSVASTQSQKAEQEADGRLTQRSTASTQSQKAEAPRKSKVSWKSPEGGAAGEAGEEPERKSTVSSRSQPDGTHWEAGHMVDGRPAQPPPNADLCRREFTPTEVEPDNDIGRNSLRSVIEKDGLASRGLIGPTPEASQAFSDMADKSRTFDKPVRTSEERKSLLNMNTTQEREMVIQPAFWEARYDPDRMHFCTITYDDVLPAMLLGMLQMFCYAFQYNWMNDDWFALWRLPFKWAEFECINGLAMLYGTATGMDVKLTGHSMFGVGQGVLYYLSVIAMGQVSIGKYIFSDFTCSVPWIIVLIGTIPLQSWRRKTRMSKWSLIWYVSVVWGSFGSWFFGMVNILVYMLLFSVDKTGTVASFFLSFAFAACETLQVMMISYSYNAVIWRTRRDNPNKVLGDQKWVLGYAVMLVNAYMETGKLVALLCGAIRATEIDFLQSVAVSASSSLFMSVLSRTDWMSVILAKITRRPSWVCPTFITAFHMDCKFAMGWPRFFVVFGLLLARGFMHGKWGVEWTPRESDLWCWNGFVLCTLLIVFVFEVLEDWIVFSINSQYPAPVWAVFEDCMREQFSSPGYSDIFHVSHYFVPQTDLQADDQMQFEKLAKLGGVRKRHSTVGHRRSTNQSIRQSSTAVNTSSEKLVVSPNFRGVRRFTWFQLQVLIPAIVAFVHTTMQFGLGVGSYLGNCRPIQLEGNVPLVLRMAIVITKECEGEVPPRP